MPIHVRAAAADYGEACLLPGDPLRARTIAEQYLDRAVEVNGERGLLGYTGEFEGRRVSVQATGMGCPSTAIIAEELAALGVRRLLRVGTCGALQPELALGDLVAAVTAVPADGTSRTYVPEPHCPTADWDLLHGLVHAAKGLDEPLRVGPIASSDVFYNPDPGQYARWAERGVLAVEMEAAALFTVATLRGVAAGCLLAVSDQLAGDEPERIGDTELQAAVERMSLLALHAATV